MRKHPNVICILSVHGLSRHSQKDSEQALDISVARERWTFSSEASSPGSVRGETLTVQLASSRAPALRFLPFESLSQDESHEAECPRGLGENLWLIW